MVRQSYVIPCLLGVFLGLMFYGVQISLAAMNMMVAPREPITACSLSRISESNIEIQVLGKSLHTSPPVSMLVSGMDGQTRQIKELINNKYSQAASKAAAFYREEVLNARVYLDNWLDSAGNLYRRGLELCTERAGK